MTPEILVEIERLIATLGFPIVCVIFMWRKITDSDEKQTALLIELTDAINNLTEYIKLGESRLLGNILRSRILISAPK